MTLLLPLHQILLHQSVLNAVRIYRPDFIPVGFKRDRTAFMAPLNRMESVLAAELLPPITVKYSGMNNGVPYYEIIDGRHRFARALITGRADIPSIVT